jgi:hypothetical protein
MTVRMIALTQIDSRANRRSVAQEIEQLGEDDGHEGVADVGQPTRPVDVNPAFIRSMTDRREGPGTRITFADGGGFSVTETRETILQMANPS